MEDNIYKPKPAEPRFPGDIIVRRERNDQDNGATLENIACLCFGLLIGWLTYYIIETVADLIP